MPGRTTRKNGRAITGKYQLQRLELREMLAGDVIEGFSTTSYEEIAPGAIIQRTRNIRPLDLGGSQEDSPVDTPTFPGGGDELNGNGLEFNFVPAAGTSQDAIDGFAAAGAILSDLFTDDILVTINIGFQPLGAGILAQAGSNAEVVIYEDVRDALVADAMTPSDTSSSGSLPAGQTVSLYTTSHLTNQPIIDNNNSGNNFAWAVNRANAKAMGVLAAGDTAQVEADITFSSSFTFDFDRSDGIATNAFDFVGIAVHEIGHALGFTSGVDTVDATVGNGPSAPTDLNGFAVHSALDLFRFSDDSIAMGADIDTRADGDDKFFSVDGGTTAVTTFSEGRFNGDGQQASHWKDNLFIGFMDPTLANGEFADVTPFDLLAFDVMGWDLANGLNGVINEFVADHTGTDTDAFVEIFVPGISSATDISNLTLLEIEGDGTGAGVIDEVVTLGTTNADGYFTANFDAENGTLSYLLVAGFNGTAGQDLDTDNDGVFDIQPWSGIIDAVGVSDGGASDRVYGGVDLGDLGGASRIPNGTDTDSATDWQVNDFDGSGLPSFPAVTTDPGEATNTPGAVNVFVPVSPGVTTTQTDGSTDVNEQGPTSDTFDVVLDAEPTADVTITVGTSDGQTTVDMGTLTFTTANWDTPQTVTVTAVDDATSEGAHTGAVTFTVASADSGYSGLSVSDVTVNITDNDTVGVTVTETDGSTTVAEENTTSDTFTVVLDSQPTADVTIAVGTADGETSASPTTLTFTAANWDTAQTVTVTAVDDSDVEGAHTGAVSLTVTSADTNYDGFTVSDVSVDILDNDAAPQEIYLNEILFNPPGSDSPNEYIELRGPASTAIAAGTYLVNIESDSNDPGDVNEFIDLGGLTFGSNGYLVIAPAATPYTIDSNAGMADVGDGDQENASNTFFLVESAAIPDVNDDIDSDDDGTPDGAVFTGWTVLDSISILDDDDAIEYGYGSIVFAENSTTQTINSPAGSLIVDTGAVAAEYVARVGTSTGSAAADWYAGTLEGTLPNLNLIVGSTTPASFGGTPLDHIGSVNPTEGPATLFTTITGSDTRVVEGGATDTFDVTLTGAPTQDVTVTLTPSNNEIDLGNGAGAAITLTFTSANANTPQTVTVTAVDDLIEDGTLQSLISFSTTSTDADFNGLTTTDITVFVEDNDGAAPETILFQGFESTAADTWAFTESPATYQVGSDVWAVVSSLGTIAAASQETNFWGMQDLDNGNGGGNFDHVLTFADGDLTGHTDVELSFDFYTDGFDTTDDLSYTIEVSSDGVNFAPLAGHDDVSLAKDTDAWTTITAMIPDTDVSARLLLVGFQNGGSDFAGWDNVRLEGQAIPPTAGVSITESGGSTDVSEAGPTSDTFDVVLDLAPTSDVTITIGTADGETTSAPTTLTFTTANWDTPQTVTITAVDDASVEGAHTGAVTFSVASSDTDYNAISVTDVTVNITDNDTPGVTVTESGGSTDLSEEGPTNDTFDVVLDTQPANDVTITVGTADGESSASPTSVTFTSANWDTPQTVTITAVDDSDVEGSHTGTITLTASSADADYNAITIADVTANITDNDFPDAVINEFVVNHTGSDTDAFLEVFAVSGSQEDLSSLTLIEIEADGAAGIIDGVFALGTTDANGYFVVNTDLENGSLTLLLVAGFSGTNGQDLDTDNDGVLDVTPWSQIIDGVAVTDGGSGDAAYDPTNLIPSFDGSAFSVGGASRIPNGTDTDTTGDWVRNDFDGAGLPSFPSVTADPGEAINTPGAVNAVQPTPPGITVTESGGSTDVDETGPTNDTFDVVLDTQPTADVTVTLGTADGETTAAPTTLTFTAANWDTPQTVTITAVDDASVEGAHTGAVTFGVTSTDTDYNGFSVADVTVNITDNDTAGVTIVESAGSTDVTEGGASDTYTVVLDSQPANDVTVTIGTADGETTTAPTSLTFTAANWDTAQTVTVTAVDDADVEGAHTGLNTFTVASTDTDYNGLTVGDLTVNIADNDPADSTPPEITAVIVGSTEWSTAFIDNIDDGTIANNGLGLEIGVGADPLVWDDVNRIYIQFSEDVQSVADAEVELLGTNIADYDSNLSLSYSSTTFIATISLTDALAFDKLRLAIDDSVDDAAGNSLAAVFDFRFDVLPGDANGDGGVTASDLAPFGAAFNTQVGVDVNYDENVDFNGDGAVTGADLSIFGANFNFSLGGLADPPPTSFGSGGSPGLPQLDVDTLFGGSGDDDDDLFGLGGGSLF